jgi:hypothetical protein
MVDVPHRSMKAHLLSDMGEFCVYFGICAVPILAFKHDYDMDVRMIAGVIVFAAGATVFVLAKHVVRLLRSK